MMVLNTMYCLSTLVHTLTHSSPVKSVCLILKDALSVSVVILVSAENKHLARLGILRMKEKLEELWRYDELTAQMSDPEIYADPKFFSVLQRNLRI